MSRQEVSNKLVRTSLLKAAVRPFGWLCKVLKKLEDNQGLTSVVGLLFLLYFPSEWIIEAALPPSIHFLKAQTTTSSPISTYSQFKASS